MTKERKRTLLTLIETASRAIEANVDAGELVPLVVEYGGRFNVTADEVEQVLDMKVREVAI